MKFFLPSAIIVLAMSLPVAAAERCADFFAGAEPRWIEPQDTVMALTEPDCYAWRLFIALNWPAKVDEKAPDPDKGFGADGPVVWETWRNVRNGAADTVFKTDGSDPGEWLTGTVPDTRLLTDFDDEALQQLVSGAVPPPDTIDPISAQFFINETRMNRQAYEFVRERELYNIEGQVALFTAGLEKIDFPLAAKEVKAQWRRITEADKPRYHWTTVQLLDGSTALYGLTALHITTKDIPNWLWATFEHIDNRTPMAPTEENPRGAEGWLLASVDRFACPQAPHNCEAAPPVGLEGTKWANYVLRGTQIEFIDGRGNPTLLANSQPEQSFQTSSSCITCHALSSIGANGDRLPIFKSVPPASNTAVSHVGAPDPLWFRAPGRGEDNEGALHFTQLDFVWSLFRARSKQ